MNSLTQGELDKELFYLKEMEDNIKLFEMKMQRINKNCDKLAELKNKNEDRYSNDTYFNKVSLQQGSFNYSSRKENYSNRNTSNNYCNSPKKIQSPKKETNNSLNGSDRKGDITDHSNCRIEIEKLKNELLNKTMLINELKLKNEQLTIKIRAENDLPDQKNNNPLRNSASSDKYILEIERLLKELDKNEKEKLHFKNILENLKNENTNLKSSLIKKEDENNILDEKINYKEQQKDQLERKLIVYEAETKKLKIEYEKMTKNLNMVKKQFDSLTNKFEEFKADNYNLQQENNELNKKIQIYEKKLSNTNSGNVNINFNINKTVGNDNFQYVQNINNKNNTTKFMDEGTYYPSEMKLKENKNELAFVEQKLSELLKEKITSENELFKLPDKPKTLNEINKKRAIESSLVSLENLINDMKFRIRKLNSTR